MIVGINTNASVLIIYTKIDNSEPFSVVTLTKIITFDAPAVSENRSAVIV